jgi:hypothetical protein
MSKPSFIDLSMLPEDTPWWDRWEFGRVASGLLNRAWSPAERKFKLAFFGLVLDGIYPSGRQVYARIGKDVYGKINLNGRECQWLGEMRELFGIKPYFGYSGRSYRVDWNSYTSRYEYKLQRGARGSLIVVDEYVQKLQADRRRSLVAA